MWMSYTCHYTPLMDVVLFLTERQKEFHKNAKNVNKFKKMMKRENQPNDPALAQRLIEV